jgi:hypothetical protein
MLFLGIDQHKRQLTVNLRGKDGSVILKRQVSTEWEKVRVFFADLAEKARPEGGFLAILEVCGMNPWLLEMLEEYGCREIVITRPTERSKQKTDRRDAGVLGHLLWVHRQEFIAGQHPLGVRRIQPPTPQEADDRQLTASRARMTKKRTAVLNGIHKILQKHNLEQACPTKVFQTKKVRCWLTEIELPAVDGLEMNLLLPQWDLLDEQLEVVEAKIAERAVADVFQVPVDIPDGTQLGALGAAICAAVAAGCYPHYQAACAAMVRFARSFTPNRELADLYQAKYARYRKLLEVLHPVWKDLVWQGK